MTAHKALEQLVVILGRRWIGGTASEAARTKGIMDPFCPQTCTFLIVRDVEK